MNEKQFVHLHLHTEYSLLDGAVRIPSLLARCKELNMPAVAMTDHGNMYAAWKFYNACVEKGIKPIIGCEFYVCDNLLDRGGDRSFERRENHHLILLAKNYEGYRNLAKLNSVAFADGFYRRPRIDFKLLKNYSNDLICLSGCIAGEVPRLLLANQKEQAYEVAKKYKDLFKEDYYIELQGHDLLECRMVLPQLVELARDLDIKIVATNDVHYLNREDAEVQDIMMCVQMGKAVDDTDRLKFEGDGFYLKSYDEMAELFGDLPDAISNTIEIANKCDVKLHSEDLIPLYETPDGSDKKQFFKNLIEERLPTRYSQVTEEIRQRIEYEFNVICDMGYVDYYLIVWDFINFAKTNGIPVGPGRGSGAGSVIAYIIGITDVEPFRYNLMFERFLNPNRKTMPDFDIDFCMDRRGEVIDYVYKKYGEGKVSQIITFGTMAAKNAIRDVARVLRLPISESNRLSKMVPDNWRYTLNNLLGLEPFKNPDDTYVSKELVAAYQVEPTRKVIEIARKIEGSPRQAGIHAAGVVICRHTLSDFVPMQTNGGSLDNGGILTTQYNMNEVESVGLLKMDFLGLRTLTDIKKAIDLVEKETGKRLDFSKLDYDDPEVFKTIGSGDTMCIFQLESGGMTTLMKRMQPDHLEDIIAGISLYRPGPMQFIDKYINGKNDKSSITYIHPLMAPILSVTYGCMIYQEQVMQIVRALAGFSNALADEVRYAMGKKKEDLMKQLGNLFINGGTAKSGEVVLGCKGNNIPKKTAQTVYDEMFRFSQYAFNKAHAASYAYICYQTAYLKTYHPLQLLCAILNNRISDIKEIKKYITYALSKGIAVLPPDINKSSVEFTTENGALRFGLGAIKNIGVAVIENILEERKNGEFISMKDLFERAGAFMNKRMIENLIKGGALDCFNRPRADMLQWYAQEQTQVAESIKKRASGQISIFDMAPELKKVEEHRVVVKEFSNAIKFGFEKEVLGFYMSGSPLDDYDKFAKVFGFNFNTSMLYSPESQEDEQFEDAPMPVFDNSLLNRQVTAGGILRDVRVVKGKDNNMMAFGVLEDKFNTIEVALYPNFFEKYKTLFAEDAFVVVKGKIADSRDGYKINVRELLNPNQPNPQTQNKQNGEQSDLGKNPQNGDFSNGQYDTQNGNTNQYETQTQPDITLCILMEYRDEALFSQINSILNEYQGEIPVKIKMAGKWYNSQQKVRKCNGILIELKKLLGDEKVQFYN